MSDLVHYRNEQVFSLRMDIVSFIHSDPAQYRLGLYWFEKELIGYENMVHKIFDGWWYATPESLVRGTCADEFFAWRAARP